MSSYKTLLVLRQSFYRINISVLTQVLDKILLNSMDHQSSHHHVLTLFLRYYLVPWLIVYMITIIGLAILAIYLVIIWSAILFIIPSLIFVVLLPIISDIFLIYW